MRNNIYIFLKKNQNDLHFETGDRETREYLSRWQQYMYIIILVRRHPLVLVIYVQIQGSEIYIKGYVLT
jgi:hypothetical protein